MEKKEGCREQSSNEQQDVDSSSEKNEEQEGSVDIKTYGPKQQSDCTPSLSN